MRLIVLCFFLACAYTMFGQDSIESYSYASDKIVEQTYGLPTVRSVGGGTKIVVDYQGNWREEMKGAFEYACKIWEENMPTTFPIHIKAIIDERRNSSALSKIVTGSRKHTNDTFNYSAPTGLSTLLQMKGTTMGEYLGYYTTNIYWNILTPNMFKEPDIIITYYNKNNRLIDNCSFSLEENIDKTKYDFISLALRDIAKGFGVFWQYNVPENWPNAISLNKILPYELFVLRKIGFFDTNKTQSSMLAQATQGSLDIYAGGEHWNIYAPSVWDMSRSLSTFIPNDKQNISKLLSYDFGRGSVVRDLSGMSTSRFFSDLLYWKGDISVGVGGSSARTQEISQTNSDVIGYKGSVSITDVGINLTSLSAFSNIEDEPVGNELDSLKEIMKKYHPNFDGKDINSKGKGFVSLLLNDGTWDLVYSFSTNVPQGYVLEVNTSDFTLHHSNKEYARTTDGYLRCRIATSTFNDNSHSLVQKAKYYALDFLPQEAVMSKSNILDSSDDEYYIDVEIGFKNTEGTTRIVVSQYDDGEDVPFQYAVPDIKSGKFTATVDKEYPTKFVITSYNKNGSTTSETYVLDAIRPITDVVLDFNFTDGKIMISSSAKRMIGKNLIKSYNITQLKSSQSYISNNLVKVPTKQMIVATNTIDVSKLSNGIYILHVEDVFGKKHSFKFIVK